MGKVLQVGCTLETSIQLKYVKFTLSMAEYCADCVTYRYRQLV